MLIENDDGSTTNTHDPDRDQPMEYVVRWEIELTASSPQEAARLAAEMVRDPDSMATVFVVLDPEDETLIEQVDVPHRRW